MISVIVPIYNTEKDLKNCLTSIRNQTYSDIEVLLINDGSSDDCEKICKQFVVMDKRFKYYYQNNAGVSVARNNGLSHAHGDYFTFIDSDDWVDTHYCEKMLQSAICNNADMVFCRIKYYKDGKEKPQLESGLMSAVVNKHIENFLVGCKEYALGSACRILFRKSILGGLRFDVNLHIYEDLIYLLTCLTKSTVQSVVDEYLYIYNLPQIGYFSKYYRDDLIDVCYNIGKRLSTLLNDFKRSEWAKAELFKQYKLAVQWICHERKNSKAQIKKLKAHKIAEEFCKKENYLAYKKLYASKRISTKISLLLIYLKQFTIYRILVKLTMGKNK